MLCIEQSLFKKRVFSCNLTSLIHNIFGIRYPRVRVHFEVKKKERTELGTEESVRKMMFK